MGVSASVHAGIPHTIPPKQTTPEQTPPPPQEQTPREQTPPSRSRHPLGADTRPEQTPPPRADTPWSRHTPPEIRPLLWTVRILLECILVYVSRLSYVRPKSLVFRPTPCPVSWSRPQNFLLEFIQLQTSVLYL